jgi:tetracycline 7-halogenase / FADH2 O2-dependent halogenase
MFDVAIIGSGMGGSASATMLSKLGYKVVLIEKGKLPRFVIGESTTPLMSKKIRYLGRLYEIPEFEQMSTYDRIKENDLPFTCAPKELFHYFWQEPGQTEAAPKDIIREIIVQTPEVDTQLLRGESDKHMVNVAVQYGAEYRDMTDIQDLHFFDDKVVLDCKSDTRGEYSLEAKYLIDSSGFKSLISQKLNLALPKDELDIPLKSRSIFSHFENINRFEDVSGASEEFINRTPAGRERATQHHCFNGGWVWIIPFENGVTSVGLNLDIDVYGENDLPAETEFWDIISRYPIIHKMIEGKGMKFPLIKTGRIQHRVKEAVGDRWAMLPGAALGGDAWFSTGLAFTLMCAHRVVDLLHTRVLPHNHFDKSIFKQYETAMFKEWKVSCTMIDGIYKSLKHFEVFKHYCFFCFMGAETFIHNGGVARPHDMESLLLNAGDDVFMERFNSFYELVLELNHYDKVPNETVEYMRRFIQEHMKVYNYRDYGNPIYGGVHKRVAMHKSKYSHLDFSDTETESEAMV